MESFWKCTYAGLKCQGIKILCPSVKLQCIFLPDSTQARPAELLYVHERGGVSVGFLPEVLSEAHCGAHHRHQLRQLLHQGVNILLLGPQSYTGERNSSSCSCLAGRISHILQIHKAECRACFCVCVRVHITCSSQEGTEANTCTLVFKLHHIHPTGGNKLDQLFTQLQPETMYEKNHSCVVGQVQCWECLQKNCLVSDRSVRFVTQSRSEMYVGPKPFSTSSTKGCILKSILWQTGSQWKDARAGVIGSTFWV